MVQNMELEPADYESVLKALYLSKRLNTHKLKTLLQQTLGRKTKEQSEPFSMENIKGNMIQKSSKIRWKCYTLPTGSNNGQVLFATGRRKKHSRLPSYTPEFIKKASHHNDGFQTVNDLNNARQQLFGEDPEMVSPRQQDASLSSPSATSSSKDFYRNMGASELQPLSVPPFSLASASNTVNHRRVSSVPDLNIISPRRTGGFLSVDDLGLSNLSLTSPPSTPITSPRESSSSHHRSLSFPEVWHNPISSPLSSPLPSSSAPQLRSPLSEVSSSIPPSPMQSPRSAKMSISTLIN